MINTILCGDAGDVLAGVASGSVALTVTSPPYDNIRDYKGFVLSLPGIIRELFRVTMDGGVVVWIVADGIKDGSESLSSFKQAISFVEAGFRLHDTMIYHKSNPAPNGGTKQKRFFQTFEYMFVFSKGAPKTFNPLYREKRNKWNDGRTFRVKKFSRRKNGEFADPHHYDMTNDLVLMENVWTYVVGGGNSSEDKIKHPAVFPEQLALDHILVWSNPGDLVLDPMCGSGTTLKMAKLSGRTYLGIDIAEEYCEIARERVESVEIGIVSPYVNNGAMVIDAYV